MTERRARDTGKRGAPGWASKSAARRASIAAVGLACGLGVHAIGHAQTLARASAAVSDTANAPVPTPTPTTVRAPAPVVAATVPASQVPQPGHVRLDFKRGSSSCDSEALFRQIFASEFHGPDPFVLQGDAAWVVEVRLDRDPPGYRGMVELRDASGEVVFHTEGIERTCNDASDRVMVALLVNVFGPAARPAPPVTTAPPAPEGGGDDCVKHRRDVEARLDAQDEKIEELQERVRALQKALDEEKRKMDLTFALSAGALMTANLTANVGPGVWIEGDARMGPLSLGLSVRAVLPAAVYVGPYTVDVSQVTALLTPCGRYSYFFGCAVAGAGVQIDHEADPRFGEIHTDSGPVLQLGGRVGAEVFFGDTIFGARAWGEVLYSAPKAGYGLWEPDGTKHHWDRPDVSAFFGLGLVVKLGNVEAK